MENVKLETYLVNEDGSNFILLIGTDAYYGTLEELEEKVADFVESKGDVNECFLGIYNPLDNVDIEVNRKINIPFNQVDEEYDVLEEEYEVHLRGRKDESFDSIENALEHVSELLEDDESLELEDDIHIIRNLQYGVSYEAEAEIKVKIEIPPQQKEVKVVTAEPKSLRDPSDMTREEMEEELLEMHKRVSELSMELTLRKHNE